MYAQQRISGNGRALEVIAAASLADELTDCLGFVTRGCLKQFERLGTLATLSFNDAFGGFLAYRHRDGYTHICYTAIEEPLRRIENASALVTLVALDGLLHNSRRIRLWCAHDLEANHFWSAIGGRLVCWDNGKGKRSRRRNLWVIDLPNFLNSGHAQEVQTCPTASTFSSGSSSTLELKLPATSALSQSGPTRITGLRLLSEARQTSLQAQAKSASEIVSASPCKTGETKLRALKRIGSFSLSDYRSLRPDITSGFASALIQTTNVSKPPAAEQASN